LSGAVVIATTNGVLSAISARLQDLRHLIKILVSSRLIDLYIAAKIIVCSIFTFWCTLVFLLMENPSPPCSVNFLALLLKLEIPQIVELSGIVKREKLYFEQT